MLARVRKAIEEKDEGFTLIELLVVIIIIGILAAIAIPVFLNQRKKGYDAQTKSDLRNAAIEVESYFTDNQVYPDTVTPGADAGAAGTVYYKQSTNAGAINAPAGAVKYVTADGTALEVTKKVAFCLFAVSDSGTTWVYNSGKGGVQPKGATCP